MTYPSRKFPIMECGTTQEIEWPFRFGQGLVIRLPFTTKAVVVGRWIGDREEEEALSDAIGARKLDSHVA